MKNIKTVRHQESIHWAKKLYGTAYHKTNTCTPRNPNRKGTLAKASNELNRRRVAHQVTVNSLRDGGISFKKPGSMKW